MRAGFPQRVGGFVEVLRPCGQAARSELEAMWNFVEVLRPCGQAARRESEALSWRC